MDVAHTAPTNSPTNPHYGWKGSYRNCEMAKEYSECKTTGVQVFGETSSLNLEKFPNLQRLTFNPNYKQMVAEMNKFIDETRKE